MAARRGKSQARRHQSNGLPGWAWLVLGILATLLVVLAVPRLLKSDGSGDGFFRPRPNPDALPATVNADGDAIAPDTAQDTPTARAGGTASKPKPTQYDFYTLLPGEEVAISDAELAASAKAESDAEDAAQKAAAATAQADAGALPPPIADNTPASTTPSPASSATPASTAAAPAAAAPANDARYILQAGAFGGSGDAEAVKAKIALLGLNARVESAQISGKTVYRVRMGPYGSASELADAKAKLSSGGLPAMAVKTN
ncbi:MAG: SPOR domain-containing protein [Pseudomonadota bacterium]